MNGAFFVNSKIPELITFNNQKCKTVYYNNNLVWSRALSADYGVRLTSDKKFTLNLNNDVWDGLIEYSLDGGITWTAYIINPGEGFYTIYTEADPNNNNKHQIILRGAGNTVINSDWQVNEYGYNGAQVKISGNIEYLLDYETVEAGGHPEMGEECFYCLFEGSGALTDASDLIIPQVSYRSCGNMFGECYNLAKPPKLPATTLADYCYENMFYRCGLTEAPELPATTLANGCYSSMFFDSALPQPPKLPATTLAFGCYDNMFASCDYLQALPALPATELPQYCYREMFIDCGYDVLHGTYIQLSPTRTGDFQYPYRIPSSGTSTYVGNDALKHMIACGVDEEGYWVYDVEPDKTYYANVPIVQ